MLEGEGKVSVREKALKALQARPVGSGEDEQVRKGKKGGGEGGGEEFSL